MRNLWAGLRLASTGRVSAADFVFSVDQVVLLAIATTALAGIGSYIGSVPPRDFYLPAIESLSFRLVLTLGFAYLATRFFSAPAPDGSSGDVTPLVVVLFSLGAVERIIVSILDLCGIHLPILLEAPYATAIALAVWGWLFWVTFRAVRLTSSLSPIRISLIVGAYLAALWSVLATVPLEPFFATDTWSQASQGAASIDAEQVMYDQRDQVEHALNSLAPERPDVADLYFVAFAGDASQAVFRSEVEAVRQLFERSLGARDRSISLINSDQTIDRRPLASSTNLAAVLAGIGQRMDPGRDVLFLFLTSHGSQAPELVVEFSPIPLRPITPGDLRGMLDAAGIRWRVVVISACFSGGFIETLENDETLVITASAADRESFGCDHEADFTYFGRAYFQQELSRTRSFEAAFEAARTRITELERSEGKEPSLPQMAMGEKIRPLLREIEKRFGIEANAAP
ncbi:MAG: C13 family peptidase [Myxococcota bacterium]